MDMMADSHVTNGFLQNLYQKIERLEGTIAEMLKVHHNHVRRLGEEIEQLKAELALEKSRSKQ